MEAKMFSKQAKKNGYLETHTLNANPKEYQVNIISHIKKNGWQIKLKGQANWKDLAIHQCHLKDQHQRARIQSSMIISCFWSKGKMYNY